jgi:3-oxoacyl-[acyl-carrier-protein] synthase-3
MRFRHVRIASLAHVLPPEVVTSLELEERLAPLYQRLGLRAGRLELMSGIRARRFFPRGTLPSEIAARAGGEALAKSRVDRERIGCLIHASVCRDFLEPATATVVHAALGLPDACTVFDLSNACLGVMNAMAVIAAMIERQEIEAGLVVAGEDGRALVEETIRSLLADQSTSRDDLKRAFASLTIGSGGAAVVLARAEPEQGRAGGQRLVGGAVLSATRHNDLCRGDRSDDGPGALMSTDSERLLTAGTELAARAFEVFLETVGWAREEVQRVVTHQVGSAHRRLLLETLRIDPARDYPTYPELGNAGSASLPTSLSLALEAGAIRSGERLALLGIGSGLNSLMLGVEW